MREILQKVILALEWPVWRKTNWKIFLVRSLEEKNRKEKDSLSLPLYMNPVCTYLIEEIPLFFHQIL